MFCDLMCIILKAKPNPCASGHWGCSCRNTRPRSHTTIDSSSDQKVITGSLLLLEVKWTLKFSLLKLAKRLGNVYLICMHSICKASYFHVLYWVNFLLLLNPVRCLGRMIRTAAKEVLEQKKDDVVCRHASPCLGKWRWELVSPQSSWTGLDVPERAAKYLSNTRNYWKLIKEYRCVSFPCLTWWNQSSYGWRLLSLESRFPCLGSCL